LDRMQREADEELADVSATVTLYLTFVSFNFFCLTVQLLCSFNILWVVFILWFVFTFVVPSLHLHFVSATVHDTTNEA
jgi:hypothetical protein